MILKCQIDAIVFDRLVITEAVNMRRTIPLYLPKNKHIVTD